MPRGGARPGSGRKPKEHNERVREIMNSTLPLEDVFAALAQQILKGNTKAADLWLKYNLGVPVQRIDHTTKGEKVSPDKIILTLGDQITSEKES